MFGTINKAYRARKKADADNRLILESVLDVEETIPGSDEEMEDLVDTDSVPEDVYKALDRELDRIVSDPKYDDTEAEELVDDEYDEDEISDDELDAIIDEAVNLMDLAEASWSRAELLMGRFGHKNEGANPYVSIAEAALSESRMKEDESQMRNEHTTDFGGLDQLMEENYSQFVGGKYHMQGGKAYQPITKNPYVTDEAKIEEEALRESTGLSGLNEWAAENGYLRVARAALLREGSESDVEDFPSQTGADNDHGAKMDDFDAHEAPEDFPNSTGSKKLNSGDEPTNRYKAVAEAAGSSSMDWMTFLLEAGSPWAQFVKDHKGDPDLNAFGQEVSRGQGRYANCRSYEEFARAFKHYKQSQAKNQGGPSSGPKSGGNPSGGPKSGGNPGGPRSGGNPGNGPKPGGNPGNGPKSGGGNPGGGSGGPKNGPRTGPKSAPGGSGGSNPSGGGPKSNPGGSSGPKPGGNSGNGPKSSGQNGPTSGPNPSGNSGNGGNGPSGGGNPGNNGGPQGQGGSQPGQNTSQPKSNSTPPSGGNTPPKHNNHTGAKVAVGMGAAAAAGIGARAYYNHKKHGDALYDIHRVRDAIKNRKAANEAVTNDAVEDFPGSEGTRTADGTRVGLPPEKYGGVAGYGDESDFERREVGVESGDTCAIGVIKANESSDRYRSAIAYVRESVTNTDVEDFPGSDGTDSTEGNENPSGMAHTDESDIGGLEDASDFEQREVDVEYGDDDVIDIIKANETVDRYRDVICDLW